MTLNYNLSNLSNLKNNKYLLCYAAMHLLLFNLVAILINKKYICP